MLGICRIVPGDLSNSNRAPSWNIEPLLFSGRIWMPSPCPGEGGDQTGAFLLGVNSRFQDPETLKTTGSPHLSGVTTVCTGSACAINLNPAVARGCRVQLL